MAFQPETASYDTGVYQLETVDAVQGGAGGLANKPLLNLANRTAWLYQNLNSLLNGSTIPSTVAPLNSPAFTGTPTAPTPTLGDSSTKIATTAFVQGTISGVLSLNVAGSANVALTTAQAGNGILNFTGALTGNISVVVPGAGKWIVENNTTGAYTLTVKTAAGTGVVVSQGKTQSIFSDSTNVYLAVTDFISPSLTGVPTAPTPTAGTQNTQIATTAFVYNAMNGVQTVNCAGYASVTLTPTQYGCGIILLTGALTAACKVLLPSQSGQFIFANNTTGAFTLSVGVTGSNGATAIVPQGQSVVAYSDGTNVVLAGAAASSSFTRYSFTATAGQKTFNAIYTVGNVLILVNGAMQDPGDVAATDSATVTLTGYNGGNGCIAGDVVNVIAFSSFTVADALTLAGGTMAGPIMLAGGDTGVTPPQFDASTKLATMAAVQQALGNFSGQTSITGLPATLAASAAGTRINVSASTAGTLTLPLRSSCPIGSRFYILNTSSWTLTVAAQGTDTITAIGQGTAVASVAIPPGSYGVIAMGAGAVVFEEGTAALKYAQEFSASIGASGYQKLPSGLIIQWGTYSTSTSAVTVSFPLAFPNAVYLVTCSPVSTLSFGTADAVYGTPGLSSFQVVGVQMNSGGNVQSAHAGNFIAIGR